MRQTFIAGHRGGLAAPSFRDIAQRWARNPFRRGNGGGNSLNGSKVGDRAAAVRLRDIFGGYRFRFTSKPDFSLD